MLVALCGFLDDGLDLLGLGVQLVDLDRLGQHEAQRHAALGLLGKPLALHREVLHLGATALLHVGPRGVHQTLDFHLDQRVRHVDRVGLEQGFHDLVLDLALQTLLHFALEVGFDLAAHLLDAAVADTEGLGESFIDLGQDRLAHFLDRHFEADLLAGEVLGEVVFREGHLEGLGFASLEAGHGLLEVGQHGALTEHERVIMRLAALEGLAVLLAEEVDGHLVASGGGAVDRLVAHALLAQDVQRAVEFGCADFKLGALELDVLQVGDREFGINLEHGRKFDVRRALGLLGLDARVAGNTQLLAAHGVAEGALDGFVHGLVVGLSAVLLLDDAGRHLARAEAGHLGVFAQTLQALLDLLVEVGNRHGEVKTALQRARRHGFGRVAGVGFHVGFH